ncbi:MAG: hypothetical protein L6R40_007605 [Gallowayella cf. fulva]|nr:MAG: hypothetical protein L6R40_007605 [Xanthomendoza cf. fulva]
MLKVVTNVTRNLSQSSSTFVRPHSSIQGPSTSSLLQSRNQLFHLTGPQAFQRHRNFFSSNPHLQKSPPELEPEEDPKSQKRKNQRSPASKNSLRRVAVEAQRSRDVKQVRKPASQESQPSTKTVTAYCAAEQYDIAAVASILKNAAYHIDPYETALYPQVVHIEVPNSTPSRRSEGGGITTGDVFIFPSGTIVAWDVPESTMSFLVSRTLLPAAVHPHPDQLEEEDLEYLCDPTLSSSTIKGDTIILGTKPSSTSPATLDATTAPTNNNNNTTNNQPRTIDTVLTKIAFSSGLARSTKLAVLETLLSTYLSTTLSIPRLLSLGSRLPYTRTTILQKTGQLLSLRAQLNLYSELTDSLPDLFWDSKYELGLEGYYDMVGRALDVGVRIKVLNGKLDYATEIAEVLRGQLSERHGVRLEWIIIALITVEVGFAVRQEVKEYRERRKLAE